MVPVRQNFNVAADWFVVGSTNALTTINSGATDDQKVIMFVIDGLTNSPIYKKLYNANRAICEKLLLGSKYHN